MSGVVSRRSTAGSQARYADAVNLMTLVAPPVVLRALYEFSDEVGQSNAAKSQQRHNETLTTLLREIRRDVHPKAPRDAGMVFRLMNVPDTGHEGDRRL